MKVNVVGKEFSEVDQAYLAGFLDADGAIMATIEKHQEKRFGFRVRVTLKITQRDRTVLDWFARKFKVGSIRKNRSTHDWIIRDQKIILIMLNLLKPYLKVKSPQRDLAIKILNSKIYSRENLQRVARLADSLSKFNIRSKNRRSNYASMI